MGQLDVIDWKGWSWRYCWLLFSLPQMRLSTSLISQKDSQEKSAWDWIITIIQLKLQKLWVELK